MNKPMTFDEIANLYDARVGGRRARTYPIEALITWAKRQEDIHYDEDEDCFYRVKK